MTGVEREGVAVCGSVRGYLNHQYQDTQPCTACRSAFASWTVRQAIYAENQRKVSR